MDGSPSTSALWIYDYLQTLPMEIQAIWSRKLTMTSLLFLLNRYTMPFQAISLIYVNSPATAHPTLGRSVLSEPVSGPSIGDYF